MFGLKERLYKRLVFKFSRFDRLGVSANFITGSGIEIGGLNYPLAVKSGVNVKFVDRVNEEDHLSILAELNSKELVKVDIIDDGETLGPIVHQSHDFVICNQFIEHCRNPLMAIENALRVLRTNGVVFMAIPDKRFTFDINRDKTSWEHLKKDYLQGPDWSEDEHFYDFVKNTDHGEGKTEGEIIKVISDLKKKNFSIHYHVWDHQSMIQMFSMMQIELDFDFEIQVALAPQKGGNESIFVLKKNR